MSNAHSDLYKDLKKSFISVFERKKEDEDTFPDPQRYTFKDKDGKNNTYNLDSGEDGKKVAKEGSGVLDFADLATEFKKLKVAAKEELSDSEKNLLNRGLFEEIERVDCDPKKIKALLDAGADINAYNEEGLQAIHLAAVYDDSKDSSVLKLLIERGADIESKAKDGSRPIHFACFGNDKTFSCLQGKGADLRAKNDLGNEPIHYAAAFSHDEKILETLLAKGAADAKNKDGSTISHCAAINSKSLDTILQNGVYSNEKDSEGRTPESVLKDLGEIGKGKLEKIKNYSNKNPEQKKSEKIQPEQKYQQNYHSSQSDNKPRSIFSDFKKLIIDLIGVIGNGNSEIKPLSREFLVKLKDSPDRKSQNNDLSRALKEIANGLKVHHSNDGSDPKGLITHGNSNSYGGRG